MGGQEEILEGIAGVTRIHSPTGHCGYIRGIIGVTATDK